MDVYNESPASLNSDEENSVPVVTLKEGLNVDELEEGTVFEVDMNDIQKSAEEMAQYDSSQVYRFYREDILDREDPNDEDESDLTPFERLMTKMENLTSDGGIKKQMLQQGVGDVVPENAHVTVHYNAYLEFADEPFDSSRLRGTPLSFDLGSGGVLPGFDIAVSSMRKKEHSRFLIGPAYGLGETGCPPRIPGGATCLYVIELLNFVDVGGVGEYFSLPISERNDAPFELVLKAVKKTKQEAKMMFESKKFNPAISFYRKAVSILESYHLKSDEEENKQQQILLQLYQNLALCGLKLGQVGRVIHNANEALRIDPNSFKAMYLKGKALRQQGDFDRAKVELMKAHKLHPKSKEIADELQKLEKCSQLFHLDEKKMYERMFTKTTDKDKQDNVTEKEAEKGDEGATSANSIDNQMLESFEQHMRIFADDQEIMEIPYSTASHTPQEIDCLEAIAKKMGLIVLRKQHGSNILIRICKHKSN